jgi:hypothetical protein
MPEKARTIGLVATLLAGAALFAVVVGRHYPLEDWLFWRYLGYWVAALFWASCCAASGYSLLTWFLPAGLSMGERLSLGFVVGVFAFSLAIFFVGLLGGLGAITFFALPLAFLAGGAPRLVRDAATWWKSREFRETPSFDPRFLPVLALGFVGAGVLYFQLLSPETFSYDARWYHIPIAQRFALAGKIARFEEGLWFAAYPLLTSYLDTWAFLTPSVLLFDRLELCAHIEFVLFLATLAQVPLLVRQLVPGSRASFAWVAFFLFPQIYLYDSNLSADADHVAAIFAIPIALTFFRAWHAFRPRMVALFALFISGAFLTKYTAISIILPPAVALVVRGTWLALRERRPVRWQALSLLVVLPIFVTATHWLRNWIWFGDPIFPMLHRFFPVHPWNPDAEVPIDALEKIVQHAPRNLEGLGQALAATVSFSFVVHDWPVLHHDVPLFGSIFTLTLPCLFFVRGARRIVWLYVGSMCAVILWFLLIQQERYLQVVLPWMVAATAACLMRIWEVGWSARLALAPLVALQLVWGGDVPFFRTHNEIHDSPFRVVAQFLASGFEKVPDRFNVYEPLATLGKTMPVDAVVVAHDLNRPLGIDRQWVSDSSQTRFSYGLLRTPAAIDRELKALGVTHLIWPDHVPQVDSLAGELSFLRYALRYTSNRTGVSGYSVGRLPPQSPSDGDVDSRVALFGCGAPYRTGWYALSQLTLPCVDPGPAPPPRGELADTSSALANADMIVVDGSCNAEIQPDAPFVLGATQGNQRLYLRR